MIRPLHRPPALLLLAVAAAAGCSRPGEAPAPVPEAVAAAERSLAEGRYGAARKTLRTIPRAALASRESRMRAAAAALKAREPSLAADVLSGDGDEEARLLRAEGLIRSARKDEAKAALDALEREGAGGERRRVLRVMLGRITGRGLEAREEAAALVKGGSRDPDAHVLHAQEHYSQPAFAERLLLDALPRVTDPAPLLKGLGRLLLHGAGNPVRAADYLERAVRERPWDRDARLDLATALRRTGRSGDLERAVAEARRLRGEDPGDGAVALLLAESLAEGIRLAAAAGPGVGPYREGEFRECLALYEELVRSPPGGDAETAIHVHHGLARLHVEAILSDAPWQATAEGSHYRRAVAALDAAKALDPEGRLKDPAGVRLSAETLYLRARAAKRAHTGDMDHTEAVRLYEMAVDPRVGGDLRHFEARWDLGLLYADLLRSPEYIRKAREQFDDCLLERERRGMPPLPPKMMAIVAHVRALAEKGLGLPPGVPLGEPEAPPAPPPPK